MGSKEKYFLLSVASDILIASRMRVFTDFAATVAAIRGYGCFDQSSCDKNAVKAEGVGATTLCGKAAAKVMIVGWLDCE